ncbi:MAG: hypothetical protein ACOCU0_04045 [Bacillota bacterium]
MPSTIKATMDAMTINTKKATPMNADVAVTGNVRIATTTTVVIITIMTNRQGMIGCHDHENADGSRDRHAETASVRPKHL